MPEIIRRLPSILVGWVNPNLQAFLSSREPQLWLISVLIGLCVSLAAIGFRELILYTQFMWLGVKTETMASSARQDSLVMDFIDPRRWWIADRLAAE